MEAERNLNNAKDNLIFKANKEVLSAKIEEVKKDEPIVPHDKVQISKTNIIKIVISCASIVVSIISLLILNIIRIIKKKAMLWK